MAANVVVRDTKDIYPETVEFFKDFQGEIELYIYDAIMRGLKL